MNPGPATSILRTTLWGSSSAATRRSATARGLPFRLWASTSARFVATSPCADRGDARAQCPTPRRALPAAPRHPPAPRGSPRAPSLVAGVCFLLLALGAFGRFRLDRGLRLRQGLGLLVPLRLLLTGPLVIGDVEAGAFEDKARPPEIGSASCRERVARRTVAV